MHYKNKRPVSVGDWVVGISHNSNGKTVCGVVMETMPKQGTCNIRIHVWKEETNYNEGEATIIPIERTYGQDDYADAGEFIRVDDGLRMVGAVVGHGNWDGPYL